MRLFVGCALTIMAASSALATPERDRAWEALIAEAQKHGGQETQLDKSASYVFQRPDGAYVTFTRVFASGARSVCLVAKDSNLVVCGAWETGKITYGWRADAASPWTHSDTPPPASAGQPSPIDMLLSFLGEVLATGAESPGGYWRHTATGLHWVNRR